MEKLIRTTGIIKEVIDNRNFKVDLQDGSEVLATLSAKERLYLSYEIYEGEEVPIEISPYDKKRGRINARYWKREPLK